MTEKVDMEVIARVCNDFDSKFGLPRQSGLSGDLLSVVVFEPPYRDPAALRGLEAFSHIWLLWYFSESERDHWSATVRPPRLGGNTRVGVFASRSPYRPNPIGLSCVSLKKIVYSEERGPLLYVEGADLMNGTPVFDIKPYIPSADSHPDAGGGFAENIADYRLRVEIPDDLLAMIPEEKRSGLVTVLKEDPRPAYHDDPSRRYGFSFAGLEIGFVVKEGILSVTDVANGGNKAENKGEF